MAVTFRPDRKVRSSNRARYLPDRLLRGICHFQSGGRASADLLPLSRRPDPRCTFRRYGRTSSGTGGGRDRVDRERMQLYLIRHGQAGSRDNYDQLSEIGRKQSVLLGEYFRSAGIRFQAAYSGGMQRQRTTAELVLAGLESPPPLQVDPRWNEFSLEGL